MPPRLHRRSSRRPSVPPQLLARLNLRRGERPLAAAVDVDGMHYVGTDQALHLPARDGKVPTGGVPYRRLPWEQVERADWHRDDSRLTIVEVADFGVREPQVEVVVTEPGLLLDLLRERVTKSVVVTLYARVRGRGGLTVVGRRSPVGDAPVMWSFLLSDGMDPADPEVAAVAEQALAEARSELDGL